MALAIVAMGTAVDSIQGDMSFTGASIAEEALQQASETRTPIKYFECNGLPKYTEHAYHLWRNCLNKADKTVWDNFQKNLEEFWEQNQARREQQRNQQGGRGSRDGNYGPRAMATDQNWERQRFPSRKVKDQIKAIPDKNNSPHTRMTLLASLKDLLGSYDLETEQKKEEPAKKMTRFQAGQKGKSFLMYMTPQKKKIVTDGPRTMLGSAPKSKCPFAIAYKLPFIAFPIGEQGRTSEDIATLSGLLDTGGCCNMGNQSYHQAIMEQFP